MAAPSKLQATGPAGTVARSLDDSSAHSGGGGGGGASSFWRPLQDLLARHPALAWRVPLGLLALALLVRRVRRTRAELFAARRGDFWAASLLPAHAAPAASLPAPLWPTHLLYSLWRPVPLVQHALLRDSGLFWTLVDAGTFAGGALAFGWRPRVLRRFFGWDGSGARAEGRGRATGVIYGPHKRHSLDVLCAHRHFAPRGGDAAPLSPVIVFFHGGAWGSGHATLYRLLASQLDEQLRCVVVCANYRVWPHADAAGQAEDVARVLRWTRDNVERHGGDPRRIVLMGHSSGAHVASMCMLRAIQTGAYSGGAGGTAPSPSAAASSPWSVPRLHGFIGLGGVYDIADHYEFEAARGVHELSPMAPANGGTGQFEAHSCTRTASALSSSQREQLPPCLLLHGLSDRTVPYASSVRFAHALAGALPHRNSGSPSSSLQQGDGRADQIAPSGVDAPRPILLPRLPSHTLYHAEEACPAQAEAAAVGSVPIGASFTFVPPSAAGGVAAGSHGVGAACSPPCPLVHVRLCGSSRDPAVQDHATVIFDFMNSAMVHEPALAAMEAAPASQSSQSQSPPSSDGHGHARWLREAILHFFDAIDAASTTAAPAAQVPSVAAIVAQPQAPAAAAAPHVRSHL